MKKYQATDAAGLDHKRFLSDRPDVAFTYVVWAEGSEVIVGKGYPTFDQARSAMMAQLRKFDRYNLGASGQVRDAVAL